MGLLLIALHLFMFVHVHIYACIMWKHFHERKKALRDSALFLFLPPQSIYVHISDVVNLRVYSLKSHIYVLTAYGT